jgi:hypothetical protein
MDGTIMNIHHRTYYPDNNFENLLFGADIWGEIGSLDRTLGQKVL